MHFQTKRKLQIIRQYVIGWILAFAFISIVRGEGTQELGSVQFDLWKSIIVSVVGGFIFGTISGFAQIVTEERGYKKMSFQRLLIYRTLYALLFLFTIISIAYLFFGKDISFYNFMFEPGSFAIYLYILVTDTFLFSLRQVNLFFGSGNLRKLFSGQFYTPREESRIFMFLDLQSSTTHAERLGHIQYSKLIQDCFNDLGVVVNNEAEIYQYVGDEAILTWKLKNGLRKTNCIQAYYTFQNELNSKADYYSNTYSCLPKFKAGINEGIVTVTEVGKYKKEIAYHGDTINIAARIQGKCNELGQELLISENLKDKIVSTDYNFNNLGNIDLKGKKRKVCIFAVSKRNQ